MGLSRPSAHSYGAQGAERSEASPLTAGGGWEGRELGEGGNVWRPGQGQPVRVGHSKVVAGGEAAVGGCPRLAWLLVDCSSSPTPSGCAVTDYTTVQRGSERS